MEVVLIVGASSGIGAATARRLAGEGVGHLILHGRSEERLAAVAGEIRAMETGTEVTLLTGDVREWSAEGQPESGLPPLDGVVWSAGVCELAPVGFIGEAMLRELLEVNLIVPTLVLGRWFRKRRLARGARIVLLGSQAAHGAGAGFAAYAASKGGLAAVARVMAVEFARREVAVCCLEPHTLDTPMTQRLQDAYGFDPAGPEARMDALPAVVDAVVRALRGKD